MQPILNKMLFAELERQILQLDDLRLCHDNAIKESALIQRRVLLIKELLMLEGIPVEEIETLSL